VSLLVAGAVLLGGRILRRGTDVKGTLALACLPPASLAWALFAVPLPPSDFWANGGTDSWSFYLAVGLLAIPAYWGLNRLPYLISWLAVTSALLVVLSTLFEGYGAREAISRARWGALGFGLLGLACGARMILELRRARIPP
jgi:hypothetical protein